MPSKHSHYDAHPTWPEFKPGEARRDEPEFYDEPCDVASATDCTGLIPTAPANPQEVESYEDLYDIPLSDLPPRRKPSPPSQSSH